jgi:Uma2 family endonuclease
MGDAAAEARIDYPTYLAIERETGQKHEWFDGYAYAMAGGTLPHGALTIALATELRAIALKCGCQVYSAGVKVRVRATGLATHPDASVACGPVETHPEDSNALTNPSLLVEVLSDGTEAYDRGEKFEHYRQIPSLRDYVLVSQHKALIEVYSRDGDRWSLRVAGPGVSVPLTAMAGEIEVDRVYAGITLAPAPLRAMSSS